MFLKNIKIFIIVIMIIVAGAVFAHTVFAGTATLNWNANAESDLSGYKVYYGTTSRAGTTPCANAGYAGSINVGNVLTYAFNNLTDGVTYYFAVSAYDTSGNESACSTQQSKAIPAIDTAAPSTPVGLTATVISSSQINLSWTASIDNVGVAGYRIYRGGSQINTSATNSYSDTGLSPSTAYTYTVVAYDAAGNVSGQSNSASATTQAAADITAPVLSSGSPAGTLSAGTTSATLSLATNENATCKYSVSAGTSHSSMTNTFATTGGTNHSTTVSGLQNGFTYNYYAKCQDQAGNVNANDYVITFSIAAAVVDTQAPTTPTALTATAVSPTQINLYWGASTDNMGMAGYKIYRNGSLIASSTTASYQSAGLSPATSYAYTVAAYDVAGNVSGQSNSVSATTQSQSLSVLLSANPSSGLDSLSGVDLTAAVSGNTTGNINYTFYCHRSDTGVNITAPYNHKLDNTSQTTYTIADLCSYAQPATYTAKVIVERGAIQAESRIVITVTKSASSGGSGGSSGGGGYVPPATTIQTTATTTALTASSQTTSTNIFSATTTTQPIASLPIGQTGIGMPIQTIPSTSSMPSSDLILTEPMNIKKYSEQTKVLQTMLSQDPQIYPEGEITGYYGNKTIQAVQRFQAKYNIVVSGTPETTGYGMAGPTTRAKLNEVFGGQYAGSQTTASTTQANQQLIEQIKEQIKQLQQLLVQLLTQLAQALQQKTQQQTQ